MNRRIVLAIGGNSLIRSKERSSFSDQLATVAETCRQIADMVESGHEVVITHGNGPQVGFHLIRSHLARNRLPEVPLDAANAQTQAEIGYMIQQALGNELGRRGLKPRMNTDEHGCSDGTDRQEEDEPQGHRDTGTMTNDQSPMPNQCPMPKLQVQNPEAEIESGVMGVVTVVTQVVVDSKDPAFQNPSKPVGPFYTKAEAAQLQKEMGWTMREDAGRGFRRFVPSPKPVEIVEQAEIERLLESGCVVIACGGGGIPVVRERTTQNAERTNPEADGGRRTTYNGILRGVAAVIDKDLASSLLARKLGANMLVISTAVEQVYLDYGKPNQQPLGSVKANEMREYLAAGQFPDGSMGPKVEAALEFLEEQGRDKPQMSESDERAHRMGTTKDEHRCKGKTAGRNAADKAGHSEEDLRRVVVITDPEHITAAMRGKAGTRITE